MRYKNIPEDQLPKSVDEALEKGMRVFVGETACDAGHRVKIISSLNPMKTGCYECRKEKDRKKKNNLRLSEEHREKSNEIVAAINRKKYHEDHEYRKNLLEKQKKNRMNAKCKSYGITLDQYNNMFDEQGGVCAICGEEETARHGNGVVRSLHIDHCHTTGQVRGLLCNKCNFALGGFKSSEEVLLSAIRYLKNSSTLVIQYQGNVELPFDLIFPINKKLWEPLTLAQKDILVEKLFNHYREVGFPYHPVPTKGDFDEELRKAQFYVDTTPLIVGNEVRRTTHMLGEAWSFFKHAYSVRCNGNKTPMEVFEDDVLFRHALYKRLKTGTYLSDGGVRKILMSMSGIQAVSNFRPTAAAAIMSKYCVEGGTVLDFCAGWGGRLVGAEIARRSYVGIEPSLKTFDGLIQLNNLIGEKHTLINDCAEDYTHHEDVDLVFTSPPYFDCEKYADEPTQSWIRYKTTDEWFNGFLVKAIRNAVSKLRVGGHLVLNIADVKTYKKLTTDFMVWATKEPTLEFVEELQLVLSGRFKADNKYEPIFVFRKK